MPTNRRARRRAARSARSTYTSTHTSTPRQRRRRPLSVPARALLAVAGTGLAVGAVVLAVHGGNERALRLAGFAVVIGIALVVVAWRETV